MYPYKYIYNIINFSLNSSGALARYRDAVPTPHIGYSVVNNTEIIRCLKKGQNTKNAFAL